jgi:hypothetical protein
MEINLLSLSLPGLTFSTDGQAWAFEKIGFKAVEDRKCSDKSI